MYQTGVYFGRFCPPHRGHLYQMIVASTKCEKLIVVISDNKNQTEQICREAGLPTITYQLRKQWIGQQLQDMDHIQVRVLDETDIPEYPDGWEKWSQRMREVVPEKIDAFFVGDQEMDQPLQQYFPESAIELFDPARSRYPISATEIRADILNNWHYILGSARPFFAKRVLIAGTESCGKTTLTKCLAKLYNTSWPEEVGRYYAHAYLAGDKAYLQRVADEIIPQLEEMYRRLQRLHQQIWERDMRRNGWEVICLRYGGHLARLADVQDESAAIWPASFPPSWNWMRNR